MEYKDTDLVSIEQGESMFESLEITMGFTYEQLDEFMSTGDVKGQPEIAKLIEQKHKQSEFKRRGRISHFEYSY